MKNTVFNNEKGTLLVHTLVMAVILSLICTMMLKWGFARHTLVSKVRRGIDARSYIDSCMVKKATEWGTSNFNMTSNLINTGDSCVFTNVPVTGQNLTVNIAFTENYAMGDNIDQPSSSSIKVVYSVNYNSL